MRLVSHLLDSSVFELSDVEIILVFVRISYMYIHMVDAVRLVVSISRHPVVSTTDHEMAPGALCDYNSDFIHFEISLFIAFDMFVHVICLIF